LDSFPTFIEPFPHSVNSRKQPGLFDLAGRPAFIRGRKMSIRTILLVILCGLIGLFNADALRAQVPATPISNQAPPVEDVVRINTRVVFIDALVRDKKTGAPVTDLSLQSFQVLDDGKPRNLSYFSREGLTPRPLALMLVLDLSTSGILYLEKPEIMEHIIAALAKLRPEDEIGIMQRWYEPKGAPLSFELRSRMVSDLTRDRPQTFAALRDVQHFAKQNLPQVKIFFSFKSLFKDAWKSGIAGAAGGPAGPPPVTITAERDLENMIDKAPRLARDRPASQVVIMEVTDDFGAESYGKSRKTAHELIDSGVTVCGMVAKRNLMDKAINVTGSILAPMTGTRFHTISYYGKQTGGEVETVGRPEEFAAAIDKIVSGLAARYNLGFTLDESERNDERVHQLEVKINPRSTTRKLSVSARRSYVPKAQP
jgi:VWFA-related protein